MLIFVYGTLMANLPLSHILDNSEFLGVTVAGGVCLYNIGSYPAIKRGDGAVVGELYFVNNETLQHLDIVEGFYADDLINSLYHRRKIKILLPAISSDVYAYFYNCPVDKVAHIEGGDYRAYLNLI